MQNTTEVCSLVIYARETKRVKYNATMDTNNNFNVLSREIVAAKCCSRVDVGECKYNSSIVQTYNLHSWNESGGREEIAI